MFCPFRATILFRTFRSWGVAPGYLVSVLRTESHVTNVVALPRIGALPQAILCQSCGLEVTFANVVALMWR